ncbi:MAG: DUF192 domain-containing protein [Chloroflexia bacterium]
MLIVNATRDTTLADKARRANGFLSRGRGLMFTDPLPDGGGLIIDPCNSIHMFFMRFPLDIVFVDKAGTIVFMYYGIKPWRMGRIVRGAKLAIELPDGTITRTNTQVGDHIEYS